MPSPPVRSSGDPEKRRSGKVRTYEKHLPVFLHVGLVVTLLLLILVTVSSYRSIERIVHDQNTLSDAYKSRVLFTDLESYVRTARSAEAAVERSGTAPLCDEFQRSIKETRRLLAGAHSVHGASWPSIADRQHDLVVRIRLFLDALETAEAAAVHHAPGKHAVTVQRRFSRRFPALSTEQLRPDYERILLLSARLRTQYDPAMATLTRKIERDVETEMHRMWLRTSLILVLLGAASVFFTRGMAAQARQEKALRSENHDLTRLAEQDGLTHLKNRRALEEELHSEWGRARRYRTPLSLLFVDVDKFKEYNDTFGHQAGDEALKQVARLLQAEEHLSSCCVARYGGEEFAVVLPHSDAAEARAVGERLRESLETALWYGRPVTVSVGVATLDRGIPGGFGDVETLLYEADLALYSAKRSGRNQVTHADDLSSQSSPASPSMPRVPVAR